MADRHPEHRRDSYGGLLCCVYGKSVENRCPWVGRRDSEVTGQLQEKGTSNMGEECGEWFEDGETVTYDPCPPGLEGGN